MTGLVAAAVFCAFVSLGWAAEAAEDEDEDEDEDDACIPPVLVESVAAVPLFVWRIAAEDLGGIGAEDLGGEDLSGEVLGVWDLAGDSFCFFGGDEDCLSVDGNRN